MRIFFLSLFFACAVVVLIAVPKTMYAEDTTSAGTAPSAASGEPVAPGTFVSDVYNAALALGGLIGFGALVYGAIMYSIAGGNSAAAGEARDQITQALLGLVLLFGAYLVLATINPSLVTNLDLPKLQTLTVPPDTNIGVRGAICGGDVVGACPGGALCMKNSSGKYFCNTLGGSGGPKCGGQIFGTCIGGGSCEKTGGNYQCVYAVPTKP